MGSMARSCVQSLLKLVNSVMGMVGISMILYAFWMFRVWQKDIGDSNYPAPWYLFFSLSLSKYMCVCVYPIETKLHLFYGGDNLPFSI